jgi:uncharacterized protein (TIGR00251 family)
MKFKITVKPNSKTDEVLRAEDGSLTVRVSVPPVEGKANKRVIELLAEYLHKPKSTISISAGLRGKYKYIEID